MSEYDLLRDFVERDSEKSKLLKSLKQPIMREVNASILNTRTDAKLRDIEYDKIIPLSNNKFIGINGSM